MLSASAFGSADNTYLDLELIIPNITKTSANYCLLLFTVSPNIKHRLHVHVLEFCRDAGNNFISVMFA